MGFYETLILGARIAQFVFAIIVLGTTGYGVSQFKNFYEGYGYSLSFSQANFLIFVAVWSLLVVGYQIFVPRFSEKLSHKFVIFGLDAITALFWFAGFIALATVIGAYNLYGDNSSFANGYRALQAGAAFGAFSWIAFMITTVLSGLNIFRGNTGMSKHSHNPEVGHSVA